MATSFRFDGSKLLRNITEKNIKFKASMETYATSSAGKLERYAKTNVPWTNRTHDARNRLNSSWKWQGNTIIIQLSHGVEYGIYLEQGTPPHTIKGNPYLYWSGASHPVKQVNHPGIRAYPIIMPTIDKVGPEVMKGLTILLSR